MSHLVTSILSSQAVDLAPKFDRNSWHVTARPLSLTHCTELTDIVDVLASKWPSLTFLAAIEQWANGGNTYWPHLHYVVRTDDDDTLAEVVAYLKSEGMNTLAVPVDDPSHATYLLGRYLIKGETPIFLFRQGVQFDGHPMHRPQYGETPPVGEGIEWCLTLSHRVLECRTAALYGVRWAEKASTGNVYDTRPP